MTMVKKKKKAAEINTRNQEPCEEEAAAMPTSPYLTQHLLVEILSKLPVKPLLRFKCVSKRWRSLISDPHFIKAHLNQSLKNFNIQTQRIFIATPNYPFRVYTVSFGSSDHDDIDVEVSNIDFLFQNINNPHPRWRIVGSCHGLICMLVDFGMIRVFNPSTRESKQIRDCDDPPGSIVGFGFGYDQCSDDYIVVKINGNGMYVYSLRNFSCWRKVHDFTKYDVLSNGTQLNGAFHWLCLDKDSHKPSEIAVFRFEDEKLWTIPLPASFNHAFELGVFEGCLCIPPCGGDAFWAMREYGVNQSWAKLHIKLPFFVTLQPLTTLRNHEAVCLTDFRKLVLYNTREGTSRDLVVHVDADVRFFRAIIYVDSLVSPVMEKNVIKEENTLNLGD
ncbi:F-box/kelch-repeat protein At3g06240-like [Cornus florida]|uniref:F-box/kelch-repeat protein At3g06240-like n=1 Tax=Cornus florida TaxID=4283 RepID=UPI00289DB0DD|nr:F-box/kelch-repeat protein At3g06240-like [Cornus florida]